MVVVADPEVGHWWCGLAVTSVVVAVANMVVVVAKAKCRVQGRLEPDARALRRIEIWRGVPGWLVGGRPLTSPQAFFLYVCSVVMVVEGGVLDTK